MAIKKIGAIKLRSTFVSPFYETNFAGTERQIWSPGPSSVDWIDTDVKGWTTYFAHSWDNYNRPPVVASSMVGEYVNENSHFRLAEGPSMVQVFVDRKIGALPIPTRVAPLPEPQVLFVAASADTIYNDPHGVKDQVNAAVNSQVAKLNAGISIVGYDYLTDAQIVITEDDISGKFRTEFGHLVGRSVTLPAVDLRRLMRSVESVAMSRFTQSLNIEWSDPSEPTVSARMYPVINTEQQGWNAYGKRDFTILTGATVHSGEIIVDLYLNTDTMAVLTSIDGSIANDDWARAIAAMKAYNADIEKAILLANEGLLTSSDIPSAELPLPTVATGLTSEQRKYADDWWTQVQLIRADLINEAKEQNPLVALDAYNTKNGTSLSLDELRASTTKDASNGLDTNWEGMLGKAGSWLSSAGSKAWDTLTQWGPTGILTAWAGYEAISSAKSSSIPTWAIISGVGLIALVLLK